MFTSPAAFLLSLGVVLLFYAVMAFEGETAGGPIAALIAGTLGVLVLGGFSRWLWREQQYLALAIVLGVLSYLGYAAAVGVFG